MTPKCKKTIKTLSSNQREVTFNDSKPASETALIEKVERKSKEEIRFFRQLEKYIEAKEINKIINLAATVSELPTPIRDPAFYRNAFEHLKSYRVEKIYLHVESLGQSAAIAQVQDENLYYNIIDFLLTEKNSFGLPVLSNEYINSACRVLASIEISNEKLENGHVISVPSAFELMIDKLLKTEIDKERRIEEKADRLVEVYEQALAAKISPECGREIYEKVFNYVMDSEKLSLDYKMKTIFEITRKAIKYPGITHTELFMRTIDFYKENEAANISRTIMQLLEANKK